MNEQDLTDKERREAEALARALEGDGSADDIPADALQTAGLLRSLDTGELSTERHKQIFAGLVGDRRPRSRPLRARWLLPIGSLAALAAVGALLWVTLIFGRSRPARLPSPGRELLQTQLQAASGREEALGVYQARMRAFRKDMYAALSERYAG